MLVRLYKEFNYTRDREVHLGMNMYRTKERLIVAQFRLGVLLLEAEVGQYMQKALIDRK